MRERAYGAAGCVAVLLHQANAKKSRMAQERHAREVKYSHSNADDS